MPGLALLKNSQWQRVMNAVAAGTTTQNSTGVKIDDGDGAVFVASFGTLTSGATTSIKLQQSNDDGSADDYSDIAGSAIVVADDDDNQIVPIEIVRPLKPWVRLTVVRGVANAVIDGVIAIQTRVRKGPATHDAATVVAHKVLVSPAEGTA